jgi:hypothetical protein
VKRNAAAAAATSRVAVPEIRNTPNPNSVMAWSGAAIRAFCAARDMIAFQPAGAWPFFK